MPNLITIKQNKIAPKLVRITPYELYLQQIRGIFDAVRFKNNGLTTYIPPQFGGLFGQEQVLLNDLTLQLTDFEVYNDG